ncbi:MAG: hypothetical protein ACLR8Y_10165 [Alistipes indistinctus]
MGQHQYRSAYDNQVKGAGGYRIENIRYRDSDATLVKEKIYKYGANEDGCGIVKNEPYFTQDLIGETRQSALTIQTVKYYYYYDPFSSLGVNDEAYNILTYRKRTFLSGCNQRPSFENGSTVNYAEIAEYETTEGSIPVKPYISTTGWCCRTTSELRRSLSRSKTRNGIWLLWIRLSITDTVTERSTG